MREKTPTPQPGQGGTSHDSPEASPEDLAAEFLLLRSDGKRADESAFLERLPDTAQREEFKSLVAAATKAEQGLPRSITGGTLLANRYRILEPVGAGGMGRVFSAIDEKLGCKIAIKVLAPLAQGNREREALFHKESRILADLKHPGIVAVHDAGRDGEYTYIAMDLVEGQALADVLDQARSKLVLGTRGDRLPRRKGSLLSDAIGRGAPDGRDDLIEPEDWYRSCAKILTEIARTLEVAHAKQVVHRDLKPANVMLQGGGHPVVLDFGLAGSPDLSTGAVTESLYGSVCYLAPEQARTQKVGMDPRTDVYQLGLILYEMLTLRRAFPGSAIGEVLKKIETGFFELPRRVDPRVPRDLEAICTMALEVQPDRRYSGARAMREDLERWLEGRSPLASRSARWRSLVRTARYTGRRHPVLAGAAAVVLALGAGALAWSGGGSSMLSLHPFRFDLPTATTVMLPPRGSEIHPHEWLGVNVVNSQEAHVWALSIFGKEGEERRVYPWRATFPSEHGRSKDPTQSWGLVVPPAESPRGWNLLCTQMSSEAEPGSVEGLLVFASTSFVPEVERWMQILSEDRDGTLYSKACTTLGLLAGATFRGVPPEGPGRPETAMDWARAAKTLGYTSATTDLPKLNLPGIESVAVECRVVQ